MNPYIGKDVVHRGCGLILDRDQAWPKLAHCSRKNVAKARRSGVEVRRVEGSPTNLEAVRRLWYLPEDPNFPTELPRDGALYHASLNGEICGGMILLPVGTHLFLNNLTADARGKKVQAQCLLLWTAVEDYTETAWRYLDVGVSYRPNLSAFFHRWATFHYPVLFHPPKVRVPLGFHPLRSAAPEPSVTDQEALDSWTDGRPYTLLPSAEIAAHALRCEGREFIEGALPALHDDRVQLIDLTTALPLPFGALVLGVEWSAERLWNEFGAFDAVKTAFLRRFLADPRHCLDTVTRGRADVRSRLEEAFEWEDVAFERSLDEVETFALAIASVEEAERLAERYARFSVETMVRGRVLHLPCHQTMSTAETELLHAIYRGHLNLCSEWEPTGVRGRLRAPAGDERTSAASTAHRPEPAPSAFPSAPVSAAESPEAVRDRQPGIG